ncbi:PTS sugar transporter subunit IIA [Agaribacterium haliotis]|uniref:PTS sugar transporter subunit IIA n=1 Tax=Agaribacterium haliotis TaxID=2013869 RepID=UPI000BB53161|nr:PTS sugar transporter subunit IIA [Agaribacterium haliotis]
MWINSVLSEELCLAKTQASSKKRVLDTLAQRLAEHYKLDASALFSQFVAREKLGSTGIGEGIAIPHCRFDTDDVMLAIMTLDEGIDFDAVDQAPVDIIIAMVAPQNSEENHLERLAVLASALQTENYVEALRSANNSAALYLAATEQ